MQKIKSVLFVPTSMGHISKANVNTAILATRRMKRLYMGLARETNLRMPTKQSFEKGAIMVAVARKFCMDFLYISMYED